MANDFSQGYIPSSLPRHSLIRSTSHDKAETSEKEIHYFLNSIIYLRKYDSVRAKTTLTIFLHLSVFWLIRFLTFFFFIAFIIQILLLQDDGCWCLAHWLHFKTGITLPGKEFTCGSRVLVRQRWRLVLSVWLCFTLNAPFMQFAHRWAGDNIRYRAILAGYVENRSLACTR